MKFFLKAFLVALATTQTAAMFCDDGNQGGFNCDNCLVCSASSANSDGTTKTVTISGSTCKGSDLSWMCCAQAGCTVMDATGGFNKDESTTALTITNLPLGATTVKVQVHDGQAYGDDMVDSECGNNTPGGVCSGVCTVDIDLSDCPGGGPGFMNDPHLKSWRGEWFDYMGECDLVLAHAPKFDGKMDLDIHVRTTIEYDYSYIETAALRIGQDVLEVGSYGDYSLNGVEGALDQNMVPRLAGYDIEYEKESKIKHVFKVMFSEDKYVQISTFKHWVSVKIIGGEQDEFGNVSGLMGTFSGKMLNREGEYMSDMDALAQNWQVRPEEGNLFRVVREPQFPTQCRLPDPAMKDQRRHLGEAITEEAAEKACSNLNGNAFTFCVHDVMATGDLEMAAAGAM